MSKLRGRVLIVDDEPGVRQALQSTLCTLGVEATPAKDGEEAVELMRIGRYEVVLLDINMPGMGGLETCRAVRALSPRAAILMLTVQDGLDTKVAALDAGADDYVTKPFHVRELLARVRAALRRTDAPGDNMSPIVIGEIELDATRRTLRKAGRPVRLTPKEFDLLHYLMSHAGLPIGHVRLLRSVWGSEYGGELEYLRTFMHQLRRKLEDNPAEPKYLLTEPHVGYRFTDASNLG